MNRWNQSLCLAGLLVVGVFACTDSAQASLVVNNPGFESPTLADGESVAGLPESWTYSDGDVGTINPTSGYFAPEAHGGQNVAYIDEWDWIQYYTDATFQDNVTYTLSVYAGWTGNGEGTGIIQIRDIVTGDPVAQNTFAISNSGWYEETVSYEGASTNVGHGIAILLRNYSDGGCVLYDDVTLTPEPATMGLLLFGGGLALARRRVQR